MSLWPKWSRRSSELSDLIMNSLTSKTMKVYDIIEWNRYSGKQHSAMPIFTKEEAIAESKKETQKAEFVIPSGVPPLNDATQELVNRAEAERSQNK